MEERGLLTMLRAQGIAVIAVVATMAMAWMSRGAAQFAWLAVAALVCPVAHVFAVLVHGQWLQGRAPALRAVGRINAGLLAGFALLSIVVVILQAATIEKHGLEGLVALFFCIYVTVLWVLAAIVALAVGSQVPGPRTRRMTVSNGLFVAVPVVLALLTLRVLSPLAWLGYPVEARYQAGLVAWQAMFQAPLLLALAVVLLVYGVVAILATVPSRTGP